MKTIIIGLDAFDPVRFEGLHAAGKTPNLSKLVAGGRYSRLGVSDPPQSEVSWTSIATGMNPGEHGIFDFVHRNPNTYGRLVSLLPTKTNVLGRQFVVPHAAPTIFEAAVEAGYPGISLWWPATFPARLESPVGSIPGLGTPDIFGRLGVGISYTLEGSSNGDKKTRLEKLTSTGKGNYRGTLEGPVKTTLTGPKETRTQFELESDGEQSAQMVIGKRSYDLEVGKWSEFIELTFKVGFGIKVKAVTRAILTELEPEPRLYLLPLQIHPLAAPWPYGTPKRMLKEVWEKTGPYLTLGWPQDTTGLEEGFIDDEQFLDLCDQICDHRERTLMRLLDTYEEGVMGCVFDSLDRIQHMFLRDREDVIESWYIKLDGLLGRIEEKIRTKRGGDDIHLVVVSDHGFGEFSHKVHLNRWMLNRGYLEAEGGIESGGLNQVEWGKSQAYAIGLNSIYLNVVGREGQGIVKPEEKEAVASALKGELMRWRGPDERQVVQKVMTQEEAFSGPYTEYGPDLVVGYNPGYRASAQTGLGDWEKEEIEANQDHWGADHCFIAESVPGVIFSNQGLGNYPNPTYRDIPVIAVDRELRPVGEVAEPVYSDEDQEKVEERLRELGYL